jgi:hypothetical protein
MRSSTSVVRALRFVAGVALAAMFGAGLVAPAAAAPAAILGVSDFPAGWHTVPVLPSDSIAADTPECAALGAQQSKSLSTTGTPKFADRRAPSDLDLVAASTTTMPSSAAAKAQVTALLQPRLLQCLVDSTNQTFAWTHPEAPASTKVREVHIPHTGAHVRAIRATTRLSGVDGFEYTQYVVFVRDGKFIVTLHVNSDNSANYVSLRNRLVRVIQRRLSADGAVSV